MKFNEVKQVNIGTKGGRDGKSSSNIEALLINLVKGLHNLSMPMCLPWLTTSVPVRTANLFYNMGRDSSPGTSGSESSLMLDEQTIATIIEGVTKHRILQMTSHHHQYCLN